MYIQLYSRRKNYLKGEEEKRKWSELGPAYMTEESEAEGDVIRQHPLKWRSEGMPVSNFTSLTDFVFFTFSAEVNKLIKRIDRRIAKSPIRGTIQPKKRECSTPSDSGPPRDFPEWAVDAAHCRPPSPSPTPYRECTSSGRTLEFSDSESEITSNQDSDCSSD